MSEVTDIPVQDDYPVRPSSMVKNELQRINSTVEKKKIRATILLSLTYFIFGVGVGIYPPLYPPQATHLDVPSYIYGPVLSCNFLIALLFYPLAAKLLPMITCRQSMCMGMLVIGCCRILFGTISLTSAKLSFILLSYAIQMIEGIGISALIISTCMVLFSEGSGISYANKVWIMALTVLGLSVGPIYGEAIRKAFSFSIPFYGIGVLSLLCGVLTGVLLPEPSTRMYYEDIPIVSWIREPRMLIYFFIIFITFNYTGLLSVILEPYMRQFHLKKVFLGLLFALPTIACGVSAPVWKWVTKKGVNSLLLTSIASVLTFASLILIVPANFTSLNTSLVNISVALLLQGISSGGKIACILFAADRDLKTKRSVNGIHNPQPMIIPTISIFGAYSGYFAGSVIAGLTFHNLGIAPSTYFLYALEIFSVGMACISAFKRNYRAPRPRTDTEESRPILDSDR